MGTIRTGISFQAMPPAFQNVAERTGQVDEMFWRFGDDMAFRNRVCMPAKVISFDPEKQTIKAQILVREKLKDMDTGSTEWVEIAPIADIPVHYPQGGPFILTFPLKEDDEVILVFADCDYQVWWGLGDIQNWLDRRRHDLSDAFAIPGINSKPNTLYEKDHDAGINPDATELRTKDGKTKISVEDEKVILHRVDDDDNVTHVELSDDKFIAYHNDITLSLDPDNTVLYYNGDTYIKLQDDQIDIKAAVINLDGAVNILSNDFNTTNAVGALLPWWNHTHRYVQPGVGAFSTNAGDNPYPTHA